MSREKVLIVEDEQNERTGLAELVSSWGYVAETARDGQEGYEKVNAWSPAIVVTDLKMPPAWNFWRKLPPTARPSP